MEEEKKDVKPVEGVKSSDSDFADEAAPVSTPAPVEPAKEEKEPEQPKVDLFAEKEAEEPAAVPVEETKGKGKEKSAPITYTYDEPELQGIETARVNFFKVYKHENLVKWLVTGGILLVILAAWLVVTFVDALKNTVAGTAIILSTVAVAVVVLAVFSILFRKKIDKAMKAYFAEYYAHNNAYVYGDKISDLTGGVDDKLDAAIFNAAGLYKGVVKVGSRDTLHFTYKGKAITMADAAGQVNGQKSLRTCFVGKYFVIPNTNEGGEIIIYLKGNKRALPPTTLDALPVLEDSKTMVIYGPVDGKKLLTHPVREALKAINTDATLVDVAISIKRGTTYVAMGYEDNLMVLPMDKPFNPAPTMELKENMSALFALIDAFDANDVK